MDCHPILPDAALAIFRASVYNEEKISGSFGFLEKERVFLTAAGNEKGSFNVPGNEWSHIVRVKRLEV